MKKTKILALYILLIINTNVWSAPDSSVYKVKKTYFKLGIITNYLFDSKYLKSDFTGMGILLEPQFTPEFSLVIIYSSLDVVNKEEVRYFYESDFSNHELNVKIRYYIIFGKFSIFPEMGIGGWGKGMALSLLGVGIQYNLLKNIFATVALDYNSLCERCLDIGGGGFTDNFYRANFSLNYFFTIKEKVKVPKYKF